MDHPEFKVQLNFAGSQQLAAQINAGAKCDVFAAAAWSSLSSVKLKEPAHLFAHNKLVLVSPKNSKPVALKSLAETKSIVLAAEAVPAGQYARQVLRAASKDFGSAWLNEVTAHVVSQEQDVRSVLAKVQLGEADAGIVYVTDALSAKGKVEVSSIPLKYNVVAEYPVGIPLDAPSRDDSRHFIHAMTDAHGQSALRAAGFGTPFEPAAGFTLEQGGKMLAISNKGQALVSFTAIGPHGVIQSFRGWPLALLLGERRVKEAVVTAADLYAVTVPYAEFKKGFIVPMSDGNLELVIPGSSPAYWVNWVRGVRLR